MINIKGTLTEKIMQSCNPKTNWQNGEYEIFPDQIYIEDHTGLMALNYFFSLGLTRKKCPIAVCYIDHTIILNSDDSLDQYRLLNMCKNLDLYFSPAGTGICHVLHTEKFAKPGAVIVGTNSHTPHCGGIGSLAFGIGSLDAAAILSGCPFYFSLKGIISVKLVGSLNSWCSVKDVSLHLLKELTVRGAAEYIIEFSGSGIEKLTIEERCSLTNMCVECGAITAIFPSDEQTRKFMSSMGRKSQWKALSPDHNAEYSKSITIDLPLVEPLIALPGQPDKVKTVRSVVGIPIHQVMIGGCTTGNYCDFATASILLVNNKVHPGVSCFCQTASKKMLELIGHSGILNTFIASGFIIASPSCDACVGIGYVPAPGTNSLRTISRNFKGRSGLSEDAVYLCSTVTAAASAILGVIVDPRDFAIMKKVKHAKSILPRNKTKFDGIYYADKLTHLHNNLSEFQFPVLSIPTNTFSDHIKGTVLIKLSNDISTDEIIPCSAGIKGYRSNIMEISKYVFKRIDPQFVWRTKEKRGVWIVAEFNYGQGSAREWAALAPMILGVKGVICKGIAKRHAENLINFGLLPLLFENINDYDDINQNDELILSDVNSLLENKVGIIKNQSNGRNYTIKIFATNRQIKIIKAGGLLADIKNYQSSLEKNVNY
jgi:aconitate hydratase